jgi:hypothetical protein
MATTTGGTETSKTTVLTGSNVYGEIWSHGNAGLATVASIPATPTGNGWVFNPGPGTIAATNWSAVFTMSGASTNNSSCNVTIRFFKLASGVYTSIGNLNPVTTSNTSKTTYSVPAVSMPSVTFASGDVIYIDFWYHDSNSNASGDNPVIYLSTSSSLGVPSDAQITYGSGAPPTFTALSVYGTNIATASVPTAGILDIAAGGSEASPSPQTLLGTNTGWSEIFALGTSGAWQGLGSIGTPTDNGWLLDSTSLEFNQIIAGTWTPKLHMFTNPTSTNITGDIVMRAYVRHTGGSKTVIQTWTLSGQAINSNVNLFSFTPSAGANTTFFAGDKLYIDLWVNVTNNTMGNSSLGIKVKVSSSSSSGVAGDMELDTPGYSPLPAVLATSSISFYFTDAVGGSGPLAQSVVLSETGGASSTNWTSSIAYVTGSGWLGVAPSSGNLAAFGSTTITITCTTGALSAGTYKATVTFTAASGGATAIITVTFQVIFIGPTNLVASPTTLSLTDIVGGSGPPNRNSTLSEIGGTASTWSSAVVYAQGSGWLTLSPSSGTLSGFASQPISVGCTTGSLGIGAYQATVTYTAASNGATATLVVNFTVNPVPPPSGPFPNSINLAGQDITPYVDQMSVVVHDTLGQGPGAGSSSSTQGRAATISFNTSLGPMNTAIGAGQALPLSTTNLYPYSVANALDMGSVQKNGTGVTVAVDPTQAVVSPGTSFKCITDGGASFQFVWIPLPAASYQVFTTYTLSVYMKGSGNVRLYLANNIGGNLGPVVTYALTNTWTRYTSTFTTPVALGFATAGIKVDTGSTPQALTFWLDDLQIEQSSTATPFHVGTTIPTLVRQGEIVVLDPSGTTIFGGYATLYTDTTTSVLGQTRQNFTTVEGIDYSTSLQRTLVNEVFVAKTDIQIINSVMTKYAPWVSLKYMPTNPAYTFPLKNFRNVTLEGVLQTIAGITGYLVFVDYHKFLRYTPPTAASSAPFSLDSTPNMVNSFPHSVTEFKVDDNAAINRVLFFGGSKLSNNFWQDLSPLVNGNNKTFPLAYNPLVMVDGKFHVQVGGSNGNGGTEQVVGTSNGSGISNQLISAGGTAQVLIDQNARSVTFDVAPASTGVFVGYRYSFPLSLLLTDENSHRFFGDPYLDGSINDTTIFDAITAVQRCKVLLAQQSMGLVSLKVDTYYPGIQAGMLLKVVNPLRGINGTYLVQEVHIDPWGAGQFVYHISLGAWNWNLIDFLLKLPTLSTFQDDTQNEATETVTIQSVSTNARVHDVWASKVTVGPYYARATRGEIPRSLGGTIILPGSDPFCGFSTVVFSGYIPRTLGGSIFLSSAQVAKYGQAVYNNYGYKYS